MACGVPGWDKWKAEDEVEPIKVIQVAVEMNPRITVGIMSCAEIIIMAAMVPSKLGRRHQVAVRYSESPYTVQDRRHHLPGRVPLWSNRPG
jgi:hypothetical protein